MVARSVAHPPAPALAAPPAGAQIDPDTLDDVIARGLREDLGPGDVTTEAIVGPVLRTTADLLVKQPGVVAGLDAALGVFRALAADVTIDVLVPDGTRIAQDATPVAIARIEGPTRVLLSRERLALNLLGRLSGIATLTRRYVDAVEGTGAVILDTRKTTPGLRSLEKYAVTCGGGTNHRVGLFDAVLIKDNHVAVAGGVREAIDAVRAARPEFAVEVEADTIDQVAEALAAGADRILLDNMSLDDLRRAVALVAGDVPLEASGGVSLATVRAIAETGVDYISVGALTHSAVALDVSLEVRS